MQDVGLEKGCQQPASKLLDGWLAARKTEDWPYDLAPTDGGLPNRTHKPTRLSGQITVN
jgi:hypothetical protein